MNLFTINNYEKYIDALETNKNLVLTGAPGTGKTYAAKEIAHYLIRRKINQYRALCDHGSPFLNELFSGGKRLMDVCERLTKMVQFHPSYDYSDFVEGFKPVNNESGQLVFNRIDGIFKKFCKTSCPEVVALKIKDTPLLRNVTIRKWAEPITECQHSITPQLVAGIKDVYNTCYGVMVKTILDGYSEWAYCKEEDIPHTIKDRFNSFSVEKTVSEESTYYDIIDKATNWVDDNYFSGLLFCKFYDSLNDILYGNFPSEEDIQKEFISLWNDVPDSPFRQRNTASDLNSPILNLKGIANFYYVLFHWIISFVRHNFESIYLPAIFIIDEINRGEISKIFGELFYSIDPGYRGEKGRVDTQCQNMIDEDDMFSKGFYVPDNVYIIGTMNDIDRSVEEMDFAMMRRFAQLEVTAEESYQNMIADSDEFSNHEKEEIKKRMEALNEAIMEQELGLGKPYQIGAAYFRMYLKYKNLGESQAFKMIWDNHLEWLLVGYLRGNHNAKEQLAKLKDAYELKSEKHEEIDTDNG